MVAMEEIWSLPIIMAKNTTSKTKAPILILKLKETAQEMIIMSLENIK
jgi:hypothetical protein